MFSEDKAALMDLHDAHDQDGSGLIMARIRTNCYGLPEELSIFKGRWNKSRLSGVCKDVSRINHRYEMSTF